MRLLSIPISLLTSVILARILGPQAFGQYAFVIALLPLIALPVTAGLQQLLTREVAAYTQIHEWGLYRGVVRTSHVAVLVVSALILCAFFVLIWLPGLLPHTGKWALLPIGMLLVPLLGLNAVYNGNIKGLGLPAAAEAPVQVLQPITILILCAILAYTANLDARNAVWVNIFGAFLALLFASWISHKVEPRESKAFFPEYRLSRWGLALLPFTLLALVSAFNAQVGIIILGLLGTDEQVAAMRIAEKGSQFVALSLVLVNFVIAPYIVRAHREGNTTALQTLSRQSARGGFLIALPISLVLMFFGAPLVSVTFGEEYSEFAYWPLVILAAGQLVNVFFGSVGLLLSMSGHERDTLKGQVASLVINIALCSLLIPPFGAVGAAIGVSIGILLWNIIMAVLVDRRLKIRPSAL